jgi:hypothetical protein
MHVHVTVRTIIVSNGRRMSREQRDLIGYREYGRQ